MRGDNFSHALSVQGTDNMSSKAHPQFSRKVVRVLTSTEFALALIGVGALLTAAFITTNLSRKFGLPSLLLYLALGLLFGNGGEGDFLFDDPILVERCAELALGFILFKGGYEFRQALWKKPKVLAEGLTLALVGTLLTAFLTGAATHVCLGWSWLDSFLLGAVLSSTDAAAVFSIFQNSGLTTKKNSTEVLELESSTNDPLAYALVAGLVLAHSQAQFSISAVFFVIGKGLVLGLLVGGAVGWLMLQLTKLMSDSTGAVELLWLAVLTSALGLAEISGANPLITAFSAGVVLSTQRPVEGAFWGPLVSLSEVVLFLLLGLQSFPATLIKNIGPGLLITAFLICVSRPIAVLAVSTWYEADVRRNLFLSWAGLRGASPIVFGLLPLIAGLERASQTFAIVFVVVLVSVLIQGTSLSWMAHKLRIAEVE